MRKITDVKTRPQFYPIEDMLDPDYLNRRRLSPAQREGRFCTLLTAALANYNDGSRGSEKPTSPVPAPSTLLGVADSVYWKPQHRKCVQEIIVMSKITALNMAKNELGTVPTLDHVERLRRKEAEGEAQDFSISADESRQQRTMGFIKNPKYIVTYQLGPAKGREDEFDLLKAASMFKRYLITGARKPLRLGIRECSADIRLCTLEDLMEKSPYDGMCIDLGRRPFHCDYRTKKWYQYHPVMINGYIAVPTEKEVMGDAAYTA